MKTRSRGYLVWLKNGSWGWSDDHENDAWLCPHGHKLYVGTCQGSRQVFLGTNRICGCMAHQRGCTKLPFTEEEGLVALALAKLAGIIW